MSTKNTYNSLIALKNGDIDSFNQVYEQYHSMIFFYALKFVQQEILAEEVTADVFITLWKKKSIIDPNLPIQALIYKIAKDTAYNYLKKIASNTRLKEYYINNYPTIELKNGEVLMLEKEQFARVSGIIETLPPKRLEVFKLKYYEGLGNKKIADRLGISINTVKVHLAKSRHYIKEKLSNTQGMDLTLILILFTLL